MLIRCKGSASSRAAAIRPTFFRGILVPIKRSHAIIPDPYPTPVSIPKREFRRRHALHRCERVFQERLRYKSDMGDGLGREQTLAWSCSVDRRPAACMNPCINCAVEFALSAVDFCGELAPKNASKKGTYLKRAESQGKVRLDSIRRQLRTISRMYFGRSGATHERHNPTHRPRTTTRFPARRLLQKLHQPPSIRRCAL
jgi:hypothetical protein